MFVSESFLIGSASDKKAALIEKTPDSIGVYDPNSNFIACANHFQSKTLLHSDGNIEQLNTSASPYRYKHLMQLLNNNKANTVQKTIAILRDSKGINGADIGMGNEKALNQFMAHHAIVFEPEKLKVWVSTSPWQLGQFVCYDLNKVFALKGMKKDREIIDSNLTIAADPFLKTKAYRDLVAYRNILERISDDKKVNADSLIITNPNYYNAYVAAGDYSFKQQQFKKARGYYKRALTKVIATKPEEEAVKQKIIKCDKKLNK
jgi:hypothetical protein